MPKPSLNDFLSPSSFWPVKEISISAWVEHAPFVMWLMDALRPRSVVELGTHTGYSFWAMCQAAKELGLDTELYAVDTWEGDVHAGAYDNSVYESVREVAERDYPEHAHLVRKYFDEARADFADGSVDLVHVDGRHFYDDARHDVDTYLSALSDRGVMIIHDIVVHDRDFGVWKVWEELQASYPTFGFTHCNGLGVVAVGAKVPTKVRALTALPADSDLADLVRAAYARLGAAVPTPWLIEDPGYDRALRRLPEAEWELQNSRSQLEAVIVQRREAEEQIGKLSASLDDVRTQLAEAQQTIARAGLVGRVLQRIPEPVARAARAIQPRRAAALVRHRLDGGNSLAEEIFDAEWYSEEYGIAGSPRQLLTDYINHGADAGRQPCLLFDAEWYAQKNPDVESMTPLQRAEHYVRFGGLEGRKPHPFFDGAYYLKKYPDIAAAGVHPLVHYVSTGDAEGRRPNPLFDPTWFRQLSRTTGFAAKTYLTWEGARPAPSADFDPDWYLATYEDAAASDLDPLMFHLLIDDGRPASADESTARALVTERWTDEAPLRSVASPDTGRITVVTDSVGPDSLFGGVATALILGALWASASGRRLRILTRQGLPSSEGCYDVWKMAGIPAPKNLELAVQSVDDSSYLDISSDDLWLTTSWWTTAAVRATVDPARVVYVLQEDERAFYPSGDDTLRAWREMTCDKGITAVNSQRLFDALVADGAANLTRTGVAFEGSFAAFSAMKAERRFRTPREMFFYSRPGNPRNLFTLGVEVLVTAFGHGTLDPAEWTLHCVGPGTPEDLSFPGVRTITHDALPWSEYGALVSTIDVALSLMSTPHTSYPPLDMVAAGAQVVTNSWPGKTNLEMYGPRLLVAEPTVPDLVAALGEADRRSREGIVDLSSPEALTRTWSEQLSGVVARLVAEYGRV